jgi:hypothetical protein
LIIKNNGSFVRPIDALQNPHQRRLARAIAADNGVNRARRDSEFDPIVGDDRPIPAGQVTRADADLNWLGLRHADDSRLI